MDRFMDNNLYDYNYICNSDKDKELNKEKELDKHFKLTMTEDKYTQNCHNLLKKNRLLKAEIEQNINLIEELRNENEIISKKYKKLLRKFEDINKK
tara:strand:+ start:21 stop:308 length:288 start_codon:yes stop_codon:yes gene_type:complete